MKIRKNPIRVDLKNCKNCGKRTPLAFCYNECRKEFVNKNRLRRPCRNILSNGRKCEKRFKPTGKSNYICPECRKKNIILGYKKINSRLNK